MFTIPSFMGFDAAGFGTPIDPDAAAFFARVTAAGGTLTATEETAVNTLVVQMKADGTWTPMKAIYPMVGASAAACAQNLKSSSFTGTFTSGWTFASTGVTGNGTSAFMNTNLNQNTTLTTTSGELGVYSRSNFTGTLVDMGVYFAGTDYCLFARLGTNTMYGRAATLDTNSGYDPTTSLGLFSINSSGVNSQKFYRNGVLRATTTATTGAIGSQVIYLGAANVGVGANYFTTREYAFAYISDTLTKSHRGKYFKLRFSQM
jgi:hypothetical protein